MIRNALLAALACLGAPALAPTVQADTHAYFADRIWTGAGGAIRDGVLLVRDGIIVRAGARTDVAIPPDAERHELHGRVIIPGLVVAHTSLGVSGDDESAVTPQFRAIDGFDLFGDYTRYLAAGVTTVQVSPGRGRLAPGQGGVVKLAGPMNDRVLANTESLRLDLTAASRNPPRVFQPPVGAVSEDRPFEPTRPQLASTLAEAVAGLRAMLQAAKDLPDAEASPPALRSFASFVNNRRRARISAETAAEIQAALSLSTEFSLPLVLVDPKDLGPYLTRLPALQSRLAGIVLNAGKRPGRIGASSPPKPGEPRIREPWEFAAELAKSGLADVLCVRPASDDDLADMLFVAGLFTRSGGSRGLALKMVTSNPARVLDVADRVGSLAPGHDADFVVLTDDPFTSRSEVVSTYVAGERVYQAAAPDKAVVVRAGMVLTGTGRQFRRGSVVVVGGKIRDVNVSVSAPPNAEIRSFPDAYVTPGLIDMSTGIGFGGPVSGSISLGSKLTDDLTSDDPAVAWAREGGVTSVVFAAGGSPSPMVAFKLGDRTRVLADPVAVRFEVKENLTASIASLERTLKAGKAYADSWTKYTAALAKYKEELKAYEAELAKYKAEKAKKDAEAKVQKDKDSKEKPDAEDAKKDGDDDGEDKSNEKKTPDTAKTEKDSKEATKAPAKTDKPPSPKDKAEAEKKDPNAPKKPEEPKKPSEKASLEPYRALFAKRIPAVVATPNYKAAEAAVQLFAVEFELATILQADDDLDRVAEIMAQHEAAAIVGPTLVRRRDDQVVNLPQALDNNGVQFGFASKAREGARELPLVVQYATSRGLGRNAALMAFTSNAARMLRLQNRVGRLVAGKDADLVVWSGPPFDVSSEVIAVMIDGDWVYEKGNGP